MSSGAGRRTAYPWNHDWSADFPDARFVLGMEGSATYAAERGGKAYLIVDEGTLGEFLDEDDPLLARLVKVIEFDRVGARDAELQSIRDALERARRKRT